MDTDLTDLLGDMPATIPAEMAESDIADFFGVTAARIRTLARDGVLVKAGRGRFEVRPSTQRYLSRLRESAGRAGRPSEGGDALKRARTRLAEEQATLAALKVSQVNGELVPVAEVRREWVTAATDLRNALLAVSGRLQTRLGLSVEQAEIADAEIRLALESLSDV